MVVILPSNQRPVKWFMIKVKAGLTRGMEICSQAERELPTEDIGMHSSLSLLAIRAAACHPYFDVKKAYNFKNSLLARLDDAGSLPIGFFMHF